MTPAAACRRTRSAGCRRACRRARRRGPPPGRGWPPPARGRPASRRPCGGTWPSPRPGRRARWRRRRRPPPARRRGPGHCRAARAAARSGAAAVCAAIPIEPASVGHRGAERVVHRRSRGQAPSDQRRDHLGVGGDLGRHLQLLERLEVGVIVDVAVERADHVGPFVAVELLMVERVRVGLGDDADARPPRVPEHHHLGGVDRPARGAAARRRGSASRSDRGVVAELADLGRRLVHERQHVARRPAPTRNRRAGRRHAARPGGRPRVRRGRGRDGAPAGGARRSRGRAPRAGRSPTTRPGPTGRPRCAAIDGSGPARAPTSRAVRRRSRLTAHTASRARTSGGVHLLRARRARGSGRGRRRARLRPRSSQAVSWSTRSPISRAACGSPSSARTPGTPRSSRSTASTVAAHLTDRVGEATVRDTIAGRGEGLVEPAHQRGGVRHRAGRAAADDPDDAAHGGRG